MALLRKKIEKEKWKMEKKVNGEIRNLVFLGLSIAMALILCVASLVADNVFSVVFSILLIAVLSVGFGYQYCKHEVEINKELEEIAKSKKSERASVDVSLKEAMKDVINKSKIDIKPKLEIKKGIVDGENDS